MIDNNMLFMTTEPVSETETILANVKEIFSSPLWILCLIFVSAIAIIFLIQCISLICTVVKWAAGIGSRRRMRTSAAIKRESMMKALNKPQISKEDEALLNETKEPKKINPKLNTVDEIVPIVPSPVSRA